MELDNEMELENYLADCMVGEAGSYQYECLITGEIYDKQYKQLRLGVYGVLDLLRADIDWVDQCVVLQLIELKKGRINKDALQQICRYKRALERYFQQHPIEWSVEYKGLLVGREIDLRSDFVFSAEQIPWLSLYTYDLSFVDGISFQDHFGYKKGDRTEDQNFTDHLQVSINRAINIAKKHQSEAGS